MFQRVRKPINPATILALVALVFAVTGGAYAATGGSSPSHATLTASAAKSKAKAKTGPRGPAGPKGATGAAGPAGPAGTAGAAGAKGETGAAGSAGAQGEKGEKGIQGIQGIQGNPGTNGTTGFTKNLPKGETETGVWNASSESAENYVVASISFPIPLAAGLSVSHVHYVGTDGKEVIEESGEYKEVASTKCLGSAAAPTAEPGQLCVYETSANGFTHRETGGAELPTATAAIFQPGSAFSTEGAGANGSTILFISKGTDSLAFGSWAVTAPAEA